MVMHMLTRHQQECQKLLCDFLRKEPLPEAPLVMALAARRGMGKSTLIDAVKGELSDRKNTDQVIPIFVGTVDASTIHEDFGLMAAIIEQLYQTAPKSDPSRRGHGSSSHGIRVDDDDEPSHLARARLQCIQLILKQEESHRALARDLAMSPSHFGELMHTAATERPELRKRFAQYIHEVGEAHAKVHGVRTVRLVLAIDDMDLANPNLLNRFTRSLIDDYGWLQPIGGKKGDQRKEPERHKENDHRLFWLFAFDRRRMIEQLSPLDAVKRLDVEVGRSLLEKLVPFHRTVDLRAFNEAERRGFVSRHASSSDQKSAPTLDDLLVRHGQSAALALLPTQPRALEGLYNWLAELPAPERPLPLQEMLYKLALVVGENDLAANLLTWPLARFAALVEWDAASNADVVSWPDIAASCKVAAPIWGLPVPTSFRTDLVNAEAQGLFEALLDLLLHEKILTPYQLLQRMPFARAELGRAVTRYVEYFEHTVAFLGKPSSLVANAAQWQEWEKVDTNWVVNIGPAALWKTLYQMRSATPSNLFEEIAAVRRYEFDVALDEALRAAKKQESAVLPGRTRSLLWLMAGLARIPWHDVEALPSIWDLVARTRLAVAFTISAYAWCIWEDVDGAKVPVLHIAVHRSMADLGALDADQLADEYRSMLAWVEKQVQEGVKPGTMTPGGLARGEILRALQDLLKLTAVQALAESTDRRKTDRWKG